MTQITELVVPRDTFAVPRPVQIKAVAALLHADALNLLPMLFAPPTQDRPREHYRTAGSSLSARELSTTRRFLELSCLVIVVCVRTFT